MATAHLDVRDHDTADRSSIWTTSSATASATTDYFSDQSGDASTGLTSPSLSPPEKPLASMTALAVPDTPVDYGAAAAAIGLAPPPPASAALSMPEPSLGPRNRAGQFERLPFKDSQGQEQEPVRLPPTPTMASPASLGISGRSLPSPTANSLTKRPQSASDFAARYDGGRYDGSLDQSRLARSGSAKKMISQWESGGTSTNANMDVNIAAVDPRQRQLPAALTPILTDGLQPPSDSLWGNSSRPHTPTSPSLSQRAASPSPSRAISPMSMSMSRAASPAMSHVSRASYASQASYASYASSTHSRTPKGGIQLPRPLSVNGGLADLAVPDSPSARNANRLSAPPSPLWSPPNSPRRLYREHGNDNDKSPNGGRSRSKSPFRRSRSPAVEDAEHKSPLTKIASAFSGFRHKMGMDKGADGDKEHKEKEYYSLDDDEGKLLPEPVSHMVFSDSQPTHTTPATFLIHPLDPSAPTSEWGVWTTGWATLDREQQTLSMTQSQSYSNNNNIPSNQSIPGIPYASIPTPPIGTLPDLELHMASCLELRELSPADLAARGIPAPADGVGTQVLELLFADGSVQYLGVEGVPGRRGWVDAIMRDNPDVLNATHSTTGAAGSAPSTGSAYTQSEHTGSRNGSVASLHGISAQDLGLQRVGDRWVGAGDFGLDGPGNTTVRNDNGVLPFDAYEYAYGDYALGDGEESRYNNSSNDHSNGNNGYSTNNHSNDYSHINHVNGHAYRNSGNALEIDRDSPALREMPPLATPRPAHPPNFRALEDMSRTPLTPEHTHDDERDVPRPISVSHLPPNTPRELGGGLGASGGVSPQPKRFQVAERIKALQFPIPCMSRDRDMGMDDNRAPQAAGAGTGAGTGAAAGAGEGEGDGTTRLRESVLRLFEIRPSDPNNGGKRIDRMGKSAAMQQRIAAWQADRSASPLSRRESAVSDESEAVRDSALSFDPSDLNPSRSASQVRRSPDYAALTPEQTAATVGTDPVWESRRHLGGGDNLAMSAPHSTAPSGPRRRVPVPTYDQEEEEEDTPPPIPPKDSPKEATTPKARARPTPRGARGPARDRGSPLKEKYLLLDPDHEANEVDPSYASYVESAPAEETPHRSPLNYEPNSSTPPLRIRKRGVLSVTNPDPPEEDVAAAGASARLGSGAGSGSGSASRSGTDHIITPGILTPGIGSGSSSSSSEHIVTPRDVSVNGVTSPAPSTPRTLGARTLAAVAIFEPAKDKSSTATGTTAGASSDAGSTLSVEPTGSAGSAVAPTSGVMTPRRAGIASVSTVAPAVTAPSERRLQPAETGSTVSATLAKFEANSNGTAKLKPATTGSSVSASLPVPSLASSRAPTTPSLVSSRAPTTPSLISSRLAPPSASYLSAASAKTTTSQPSPSPASPLAKRRNVRAMVAAFESPSAKASEVGSPVMRLRALGSDVGSEWSERSVPPLPPKDEAGTVGAVPVLSPENVGGDKSEETSVDEPVGGGLDSDRAVEAEEAEDTATLDPVQSIPGAIVADIGTEPSLDDQDRSLAQPLVEPPAGPAATAASLTPDLAERFDALGTEMRNVQAAVAARGDASPDLDNRLAALTSDVKGLQTTLAAAAVDLAALAAKEEDALPAMPQEAHVDEPALPDIHRKLDAIAVLIQDVIRRQSELFDAAASIESAVTASRAAGAGGEAEAGDKETEKANDAPPPVEKDLPAQPAAAKMARKAVPAEEDPKAAEAKVEDKPADAAPAPAAAGDGAEAEKTESPETAAPVENDLAKEVREAREAQEQQGTEVLKYLGQLSGWLGDFTKTAGSELGTMSKKLDGLVADGPEGESGARGLVPEMHSMLSEQKEHIEAQADQTARMEELVGLLREHEARAQEQRGMSEHLLAVVEKQRQDNEMLLRAVATDLSGEIRGERMRFIEAMQQATSMNMQIHVDQFKNTLSAEVNRSMRELGTMREQKRSLEHEIADLFALKAKHKAPTAGEGGAPSPVARYRGQMPAVAQADATPTPSPAAAPAPALPMQRPPISPIRPPPPQLPQMAPHMTPMPSHMSMPPAPMQIGMQQQFVSPVRPAMQLSPGH